MVGARLFANVVPSWDILATASGPPKDRQYANRAPNLSVPRCSWYWPICGAISIPIANTVAAERLKNACHVCLISLNANKSEEKNGKTYWKVRVYVIFFASSHFAKCCKCMNCASCWWAGWYHVLSMFEHARRSLERANLSDWPASRQCLPNVIQLLLLICIIHGLFRLFIVEFPPLDSFFRHTTAGLIGHLFSNSNTFCCTFLVLSVILGKFCCHFHLWCHSHYFYNASSSCFPTITDSSVDFIMWCRFTDFCCDSAFGWEWNVNSFISTTWVKVAIIS